MFYTMTDDKYCLYRNKNIDIYVDKRRLISFVHRMVFFLSQKCFNYVYKYVFLCGVMYIYVFANNEKVVNVCGR